MANTRQHWNTIFSATSDPDLGWYERESDQTLKHIDRVPLGPGSVIFLAGAGTTGLVEALLAQEARLIVNDISDAAIRKVKARLGERADQVTWIHQDISHPLPEDLPDVDLWIDRAVLHFLLAEADIRSYFANLRSRICCSGHVLMAEFSVSGAPRCAGLDLHRYSVQELTERMGPAFTLLHHEDYTFVNPRGAPRPYIYTLFRREHE